MDVERRSAWASVSVWLHHTFPCAHAAARRASAPPVWAAAPGSACGWTALRLSHRQLMDVRGVRLLIAVNNTATDTRVRASVRTRVFGSRGQVSPGLESPGLTIAPPGAALHSSLGRGLSHRLRPESDETVSSSRPRRLGTWNSTGADRRLPPGCQRQALCPSRPLLLGSPGPSHSLCSAERFLVKLYALALPLRHRLLHRFLPLLASAAGPAAGPELPAAPSRVPVPVCLLCVRGEDAGGRGGGHCGRG